MRLSRSTRARAPESGKDFCDIVRRKEGHTAAARVQHEPDLRRRDRIRPHAQRNFGRHSAGAGQQLRHAQVLALVKLGRDQETRERQRYERRRRGSLRQLWQRPVCAQTAQARVSARSVSQTSSFLKRNQRAPASSESAQYLVADETRACAATCRSSVMARCAGASSSSSSNRRRGATTGCPKKPAAAAEERIVAGESDTSCRAGAATRALSRSVIHRSSREGKAL